MHQQSRNRSLTIRVEDLLPCLQVRRRHNLHQTDKRSCFVFISLIFFWFFRPNPPPSLFGRVKLSGQVSPQSAPGRQADLNCRVKKKEKEKKRKDYAFWDSFNKKPDSVPDCPMYCRAQSSYSQNHTSHAKSHSTPADESHENGIALVLTDAQTHCVIFPDRVRDVLLSCRP